MFEKNLMSQKHEKVIAKLLINNDDLNELD